MNTNYILIGCGFFAAGICVGVAIGNAIGKKTERALADDQIRELRDFYNRKTKCVENEEKKEEIYKQTISEYAGSGNVENTVKAVGQKLVNDALANREKVEKILAESESPDDGYDDTLSEEEKDEIEWESKSIWASDKSSPYEITFQEFEDHKELDKITLLYYAGDGTLTTEDEELIDDVRGTVGDCLVDFAESDERTMFVRNKRLGSDFEIAKVEGSFY